jgi:enoyl-CoA hydratase/carnithine racemase
MIDSDILIEKADRIAWVILNRPDKRNTLTTSLMTYLIGALDELDLDEQVGVIVIKGAGEKVFCAGADFHELMEKKTTLEYREFFGLNAKILTRMGQMTKPLISSVHGYALAGGLGIAMGCDIVLASEDAFFGATEINVGAAPMVIMAPIFRCIGRHKGLELILSGEIITAQEAERIGLVNRVYPKERLGEGTMEVASKFISKSPIILKLIREAYYTMSDMEYFKALNYLKEMIAITASTQDFKEGMSAFLEKRKPVWLGK